MVTTRILYFTNVRLGTEDNGGALVCRNHARRLSEVGSVNLMVCTTGPEEQTAGDAEFASSIGARHRFIAFRNQEARQNIRWPFLYERTAAAQWHVDREFLSILQHERPDILVTDYVPAALFIRSAYRLRDLRRVTIMLNREAQFYGDLQRLKRLPQDCSYSVIARVRMALFEQWVLSRSTAVVALARRDLPWPRPGRSRHVISPLFEPSKSLWSYRMNGSLLFIGNIGHYPNYEAVEWIATRFAPALSALGCTARIRIIGAEQDHVPSHWHQPNVDYLGTADKTTVEQELCSTNLFIAPISNAFGSKIKLLDCLAHGTPFTGTFEALSGLTFMSDIPTFRLEKPDEAAATIFQLESTERRLTELSELETAQLLPQLAKQRLAWEALVKRTT